jgi:hypothetical protein
MRPAPLGLAKFDLVIMPRHDHPPKRKNVAITEGALNLIDDAYLKEQAERLRQSKAMNQQLPETGLNIGLLIGGDSKGFRLDAGRVRIVVNQVKSFAEQKGAAVLVSTSRRTSPEVEKLVKDEFKDFPRCRFLVIASEDNPAFAVGGILGLSNIVIISPESISMVSEAVSSGRYVVVFDAALNRRHANFLSGLAEKKYIYIVQPQEIGALIDKISSQQPEINVLKDKQTLKEAMSRII